MIPNTHRPMVYFAHPISGHGHKAEPTYVDALDTGLREMGTVLFRPFKYNPWDGNDPNPPKEVERIISIAQDNFSSKGAHATLQRVFRQTPLSRPGRPLPGCHKEREVVVEGADVRQIVGLDLYVISQSVGLIIDLSRASVGAAQEQFAAWGIGKPVIGVALSENARLSAFSINHCTGLYTVDTLFSNLGSIVSALGWSTTTSAHTPVPPVVRQSPADMLSKLGLL